MANNIYDFKLIYLKNEILEHRELSNFDPLLLAEFFKSLKNITNEDWEKIKNIFIKTLNGYTYSADEKMCLTILAFALKDELLNRDVFFTSDLCTYLTAWNKSPLNYITYAKFVLQEPIYSLIINASVNEDLDYLEIFKIILDYDICHITEKDYNAILKILSQLCREEFYILIPPNATLKEIYNIFLSFMEEENKKSLIFTASDFEALKYLKLFSYRSDDEASIIRMALSLLEDDYFSKIDIVSNALKFIKRFKPLVFTPLTRQRKNAHE